METLRLIFAATLACTLLATQSGVLAQRRRAQNGGVDFDCPDEFGYYPHPTDCTQYYVCVFGGALLESCTGGLMYSHELQTCDWPRNVGCGETGGASVSTVRVTDSRTGAGASGNSWRTTPSVSAPTRQPQRQQTQQQPQQQYPLYADELGPAEEAEAIDRQQRVYRGQPPTVGQVARDRDGLRLQQHSGVTNSIPLVSSGRSSGEKNSYVSQPQYRPEPAQATVQTYAPNPRAPAPQNYTFDPYYPAYDDEVELYRDVDYGSQYPSAAGQQQQQQQQSYRGQSPYKVSPTPPAVTVQQQQDNSGYRGATNFAQSQYNQQPQDAYVQPDYSAYNTQQEDVEYASPQVPSRQSNRVASTVSPPSTAAPRTTVRPIPTTTTETPTAAPASRRDKHRERTLFRGTSEVDDVSVIPSRSRSSSSSTGRGGSRVRLASSACDDEDLSSGGCNNDFDNTVSETPSPAQQRGRGRPTTASYETSTISSATRSSAAAPSRSRGSSSYTASESSSNSGRGRSRPTLKPATTIVSKASEYIDIYRFPPSRPEPIYPTPRVDQSAAKCRKDVCLLPDCYCGGKEVPGGYAAEQIPQLVLLTFDDSVNDLNKGLYESLFERGRVNPNGCPISATFYVSHEWTDYSQVQNLYADGHEMASHSISHSFGEQFSQKKWTREIAGQREILSAYGGVRLEDVRGMRAPFLAVGGNKMFKMLYDANFTYDSSMPIYENRPPSYPYTLDYKLFHDCMIPPCPTKSYPGVWEVPMVMWQDLNGGRCSMGDACSNPPTADGVYKMLIKNFERHYTTNRAPFGLYYHAAWFTTPHHKEGFEAFLDTIVAMDDVWLVTNWQAIQWMRDPQPLNSAKNFRPFGCDYPERPKRCNNPRVCNLWHKSGVRYMRTCQPCPDIYPWTGKTGVRNSRVDNNEVEES